MGTNSVLPALENQGKDLAGSCVNFNVWSWCDGTQKLLLPLPWTNPGSFGPTCL